MARNSERLDVILNLVTDRLRANAKGAAASMRGIADTAKASANPLKLLRTRLGDVTAAQGLIGRAAQKAAQHFKQFVSDSLEAASDLIESTNAVEKVFGSAAGQILEFGKVSAQAAGLSNREFRELATNTGALLQNFGFSAEEAARETIKLTLRASDMASIFNTDVKQALDAIGSALRQETRPIRAFGVSLSDAEIRGRAVEDGLAATTAEVTRNQKAFAALDLIYEQTDKTQGDFIDTSDEVANALRIQAAEAENASAALGEALLPVQAQVNSAATDIILSFRSIADNVDLDLINLVSPLATLSGIFHDMQGNLEGAAADALTFRQASQFLNESMDNGVRGLDAFNDAVFHIARNSELTSEQVLALAAAAQVGTHNFPETAELLADLGEAAGLSEPQIAAMVEAILSAQDPIDQLADVGDAAELERLGAVAGPVADKIEEIGFSAKFARGELRKLDDVNRDIQDALLGNIDPIQDAANAIQDIGEAEADLAETRKNTPDDTRAIALAELEVVAARARAQSAINELVTLGEPAMQAFMAATGMSRGEVMEFFEALGLVTDQEWTVVIEVEENIQQVIGLVDSLIGSINTVFGLLGGLPVIGGLVPGQVPEIGPVVNPITPIINPTGGVQQSAVNINFNGDVASTDPVADVQTAMTVASIAGRIV